MLGNGWEFQRELAVHVQSVDSHLVNQAIPVHIWPLPWMYRGLGILIFNMFMILITASEVHASYFNIREVMREPSSLVEYIFKASQLRVIMFCDL